MNQKFYRRLSEFALVNERIRDTLAVEAQNFFSPHIEWIVFVCDHHVPARVGLFKADELEHKTSITVSVEMEGPTLVNLGDYTKVDWYILKQGFGNECQF